MNVFTFTGRLGRDAEVRYTSGGTTVCSFAVANDVGFGDRKRTQWIDCALFGKRAEGELPQYLVKGAQVAVTGEVTLHTFEKRDGTQGASLQVRVNDVDLIGGRGDSGAQNAIQAPQRQPEPVGGGDFDDDLPFNRLPSDPFI